MQTYHNQYTDGSFDRIANCQRVLTAANPNFEYVGGFVDMDSLVDIRCKACGHEFTRSMSGLRHLNKKHECPNCKAEKKRRVKEQQKAERARLAEEKRKDQKIAKMYAKSSVQVTMKQCPVCSGLFIGNRTYCSTKCQHQNHWAMKEGYRNFFPLKEVYERDNGICYLCGGLCDWNDKTEVNGFIVYGNMYPSRDHVIPKSKGGVNSWENIRLAHRICNSLKQDSPLSKKIV